MRMADKVLICLLSIVAPVRNDSTGQIKASPLSAQFFRLYFVESLQYDNSPFFAGYLKKSKNFFSGHG